jgi:aminopeptidase N
MADLSRQQPESTPTTIHLEDYTPPDYWVEKVDLNFNLDETATVVHSRLKIKRNKTNAIAIFLNLPTPPW